MTWAVISSQGLINIAFTSFRMDSQEYINVLDTHLVPYFPDNFVYQQDNASIHSSRATLSYLFGKNIQVLD